MRSKRDLIVSILLAIAAICVPVVLAGGYEALKIRFGQGTAFTLPAGGISVFAVAAVVVRWPRRVKVPLRLAWYGIRYACNCVRAIPLVGRIHDFIPMAEKLESTIRQKCDSLDDLAEQTDKLESHIQQELSNIDERIGRIYDDLGHVEHLKGAVDDTRQDTDKWREIMLKVFPWIHHIVELQAEETRGKALQFIHQMVDNSPSDVFTDEGLASVIREVSRENLANSADAAEKELTHAIRRAAYKLDEDDFRQTKMSLRNSARRMLNHGNGSITFLNVLAFDEITRHADRWPYGEVQSVIHRLRMIRQSNAFADALHGGSIVLAPAFASQAAPNGGFKRVWKRVWAAEHPDNSGGWGRIRCLLDNGEPCEGGELEEVSLGGAACLSCMLESPERILKCELFLPCYPEPVSVKEAEFRKHDGCYFSADTDRRIAPGFSIEFRDMETEQFETLSNYIRPRGELNPEERPPNAPKKPTPELL